MLELNTVAGTEATVSAGAVLSMLAVRVAVDELPALSVADPETDCDAPSEVRLTDAGHEPTPDSVSLHVKSTVASVLIQPELLAAGWSTPVIVGGVLSRFIVALELAVFPALSAAVPLTI